MNWETDDMVLGIAGYLFFSALVAWLATHRGRGAWTYFALSILASPPVALIVLVAKKDISVRGTH